jgi:DNA-binding TFAR19-related protein (PDSD5 family)
MADTELDRLRKRKLLQIQKRFLTGKTEGKAISKEEEKWALLNQVFIGRAWEVFRAAKLQYPEETKGIEEVLVRLIMEGKIKEKISGEELYSFFHQLGLRIELKTCIRFMEHGKLKSLEEKMKGKD